MYYYKLCISFSLIPITMAFMEPGRAMGGRDLMIRVSYDFSIPKRQLTCAR